MCDCSFLKYNKLTVGCNTSKCLYLTTSTTTSSTTTITSTSTTTTTTTSSTTTTTTTAAPTTTTTTTSTTTTTTTTVPTTTTTTTSSTTTTTTTEARDPLEIFVVNSRSSVIGYNTQAWSGITPYYNLSGNILSAGNTQTTFNGMFGISNSTKLRYENTGNSGVTVTMYFSDDNGSSYSLLGSANLAAHAGGSAPYDFVEQTYTTTPNGIGVTNLIQFLVTDGQYSTSQYIIRVVNNTGFTVDLDIIGRSSPSNNSYFTSTNVNIATGSTQVLSTATLLEAATRITMNNNGEQVNVAFYYSNNNGSSYSLVGTAFLGISGTLDNAYSTATPGNNATCILEIRLS